jgi:hypothetical protein
MATQKSARRSRKRHSPGKVPRAVPSDRRQRAAARQTASAQSGSGQLASAQSGRRQPGRSTATTYGERPPGPFGGLPVSELAIFVGLVGVVIGWTQRATPALVAGIAVCAVGVLELTAREHFSGYRSHSALLAGIVAVAVETLLALLVVPGAGLLLLLAVVPVFGGCFVLLRRRFSAARQARVRAFPPA